MKEKVIRRIGNMMRSVMTVSALLLLPAMLSAQSAPPPGAGQGPGGGFGGGMQSAPPPGAGSLPPNGIGWNPGPASPPPVWGNPWGSVAPIINNPAPTNQGTMKVIACGYDAQGVWRVLPLLVNYQYNGVQYNVTVINAWNPWTDTWNQGVDQPAYNTSYYLRGQTFNFYTVLSTGTYYFNL